MIKLLTISGLFALVVMAAIGYWPVIAEAWERSRKSARAVFLIAAVGMMFYGGAKNGKIDYPKTISDFAYFTDNGSTNMPDRARLKFTISPFVPASASFIVDGCEVCWTSDQQIAEHTFNALTSTVGELTPAAVGFELDILHENATNYNWWVYSTWLPDASRTNGVAEVLGWQCGATNKTLLKRTGYYINGVKEKPQFPIYVDLGGSN